VALLLSKNANPTIQADESGNARNMSPAHIAAAGGSTEVIQEFINHGYDLKIANGQSLNSEITAWEYGHTKLAKMIGNHIRA